MAFSRRLLCLLVLLPVSAIAQSPQNEPFPIEIFESAPAPREASDTEAGASESRRFDFQPDEQTSASAPTEIMAPEPLSVDNVEAFNLYVASVPVRSRFPEDRTEALQAALAVVLTRLTGQADSGSTGSGNNSRAGWQRLVDRAPQLVQQYRYETPPPSADGFGPRPSQLRLRAEFSQSIMQREMQLAGLPVLTGERPTTLLWPLQKTANGWQLLSADSPLREQWQQQASDRGFKLLLAVGDFPVELSQLTLPELDEQLRSLGESLVVGQHEPVRVVIASDIAQRWAELAGLQRRWLARDNSEKADGLATLLDGYTERSTNVEAAGPGVKLAVSGINSIARYATLQRYLQQLEQVQNQQLYEVSGDTVTLNLRLRGDTTLLRSALALSDTLQVDRRVNDGTLHYRWAAN